MEEASLRFIIGAILIFLAGSTNGFKDKSSENKLRRTWWNKGDSWINKWAVFYDGSKFQLKESDKKPWYYFGLYKPKYKERFAYSSTFLVALTDGWHLLQLIQFKLIWITIPIIPGTNILWLALTMITVYGIVFSMGFTLTYDFIIPRLTKNKIHGKGQ